jgi:hypothetical protein
LSAHVWAWGWALLSAWGWEHESAAHSAAVWARVWVAEWGAAREHAWALEKALLPKRRPAGRLAR